MPYVVFGPLSRVFSRLASAAQSHPDLWRTELSNTVPSFDITSKIVIVSPKPVWHLSVPPLSGILASRSEGRMRGGGSAAIRACF
jgi:hypothetical protein